MTTRFVARPGGRLAYTIEGSGPLVICVPGMGDLRAVYRFLGADLVAAGHRVAVLDLRGHGDSDVTFDAFDDVALADDVTALALELAGDSGEPVSLTGNSMGAGAAVLVAARRPELVSRLVLIGPFVRDAPGAEMARVMLRVLLARPWGRAAWRSYWRSLYPGTRPAGFDEHQAAIDASLRDSKRWRAFVRTTQTSHAAAGAALADVAAPTLVVMGTADRDWKDPTAEAREVADTLRGELLMVDGAGHYPQAQRAELVSPAVVAFLAPARA